MINKDITLFSNGEYYDDWDIIAVIFLPKKKVIEYMKEFFRKTNKYKILNPKRGQKYATEILRFTDKETLNEFFSSISDNWKTLYYNIKEVDFLSVDENDVNKCYTWIDRNKFLEFLESLGVLVIKKEDLNTV